MESNFAIKQRRILSLLLILLFKNKGLHVEIGAVFVEQANALTDKQGGAYRSETHGMESAGAAEVDNNAGGDPDDIAGGLDLRKWQLVNGADRSHKGVRSRQHQVSSDDKHNAEGGDDNAGDEKNYAQPERIYGVVHNEHKKVDKVTEGDGERKSEYDAYGRLFVDHDLTNDAQHMEGDGHIAEGEWGDHAYSVRHRADGGNAELKALDENKTKGHEHKT